LSNRFEKRRGGFLDMAIEHRKRPKTFLDHVEKVIDWRPVERLLKKKLRRNKDAIGNPAYPAVSMFKVLLLQRWYNLSDREMDYALADRISFCRFAGFSFDYDTPDFTTICRFRNHLEKRGLDLKLFNMLNAQLEQHGMIVKQGAIVDATIVASSRRPRKKEVVEPKENQESQEPGYEVNTAYSDDIDAKWTIKAGKAYYGFKIHAICDAEHGFILAGRATGANRADTKELRQVVEQAGIDPGSIVFADKGYASAENRINLEQAGITDGIMYKAARGRALTEAEKLINRVISRLRGIVERGFGTLKRDYGFYRARYLGCKKVKLEFLLNAMAFNLKKAALMMR